MKKWSIDMCYGLNVSVEGVEAETYEEAITKAREMVEDDKEEYADMSDLEFEAVIYIKEEE